MRRLLLLIFIGGFAANCSAQNNDIRILRNLNGPINSAPDALMRGVSNSVLPMMIAVPAGILIYNRCKSGSWTEKKEAYFIASALVVSSGITFGLKYAVNRPRPFVMYSDVYQKDSHVGPYSFPSGHTSSAFALATSVSMYYPEWYVIAPAAVWACTVGYSRMYLGVHYPTDVLAGALVGSGSAILSYYITRWINHRYFNRYSGENPEQL